MKSPSRKAAESVLRALLESSEEYQDQALTRESIRFYAERTLIATPGGEALDVDDLVAWAEMHFNVRQAEAAVLRGDDAGHLPWLSAQRAGLFKADGFWVRYRSLLERRLPPHPLQRLDLVTDDVLDSLEDPSRPGQWDRRGLVMGHVQSGKTANYVGLVAKAIDSGYKLVIVLAGVHNNLRAQTQARVDEGITGIDTRHGPGSTKRVGVGLMADRRPVMTMTSARDDGDFKRAVADAVGNPFTQIDIPTVFVIKKHVSILEHLHQWLSDNSNRPAGHERVAGVPLLLIDDEADNASINTASLGSDDEETDPTRTNAGIRRILNLFDQSAYVGYTATPFANVFIDDQAAHSELGDDLFPRDFIFALEAPSNYVGPRRVFGLSTPQDSDAPEDLGLPMVTRVLDTEEWLPVSHKAGFRPDEDAFPESLQNAMRAFVLTCATRLHRGQAQEHNSMLVHVTRFVETQNQVKSQIESHLVDLRQALSYDERSPEWAALRTIWDRDFTSVAKALKEDSHPPPLHSFEEVAPHVIHAVNAISVRALNGSSSDVLDYQDHAGVGLSVIAIGGAKLSRGLTLEGLSISYYLRASKMYDTLMQMGRWFGYRPGYLDLCRVYTSPEVIEWYRSIASATEELLEDFHAMQAAKSRPKDFGLRVRLSPGMMITSQARMRNGQRRKVNFGGTRPEVTSFEVDVQKRQQAVDQLDSLVERLGSASTPPAGDQLWRGVQADLVIAYFQGLAQAGLYPNSVSARPSYLADYVERRVRDGGLVNWTVLLKSKAGERRFALPQAQVEVGLASRTDRAGADRYAIKSLIGSQDESVDLSESTLRDIGAGAKAQASGLDFRAARPTTDCLLILYLLDGMKILTRGQNGEREVASHIPDGPPFAAFCVSFPADPHNTAIEYTVNNVFDRGMRDG